MPHKDPEEVFGKSGVVGYGGGLKGGYLVGNCEALQKRRVPISYYGAVSVAALIKSRYSEVKTPYLFNELRERTEHIKGIFRYIEKIGPHAVFDLRPVRNWKNFHVFKSEAFLPGENELFWLAAYFEPELALRSEVRFDVFMFNELTQEHGYLSNHDPRFRSNPPELNHEDLRRAVVASARIGPIFQSLKIKEVPHYDGGFALLSLAKDYGCDTIFALYPYNRDYVKREAHDFMGKYLPLLQTFIDRYAALLRNRDEVEFEKLEIWNEMAARLREAAKKAAKTIGERDKEIAALKEEIGKLRGQVPAGAKSGLVGRIVNKILSLPTRIRSFDGGEEAMHEFEGIPKPVRVIRIWGKSVPTLDVRSFAPGDVTESMRFGCDGAMMPVLDGYLN